MWFIKQLLANITFWSNVTSKFSVCNWTCSFIAADGFPAIKFKEYIAGRNHWGMLGFSHEPNFHFLAVTGVIVVNTVKYDGYASTAPVLISLTNKENSRYRLTDVLID